MPPGVRQKPVIQLLQTVSDLVESFLLPGSVQMLFKKSTSWTSLYTII